MQITIETPYNYGYLKRKQKDERNVINEIFEYEIINSRFLKIAVTVMNYEDKANTQLILTKEAKRVTINGGESYEVGCDTFNYHQTLQAFDQAELLDFIITQNDVACFQGGYIVHFITRKFSLETDKPLFIQACSLFTTKGLTDTGLVDDALNFFSDPQHALEAAGYTNGSGSEIKENVVAISAPFETKYFFENHGTVNTTQDPKEKNVRYGKLLISDCQPMEITTKEYKWSLTYSKLVEIMKSFPKSNYSVIELSLTKGKIVGINNRNDGSHSWIFTGSDTPTLLADRINVFEGILKNVYKGDE